MNFDYHDLKSMLTIYFVGEYFNIKNTVIKIDAVDTRICGLGTGIVLMVMAEGYTLAKPYCIKTDIGEIFDDFTSEFTHVPNYGKIMKTDLVSALNGRA